MIEFNSLRFKNLVSPYVTAPDSVIVERLREASRTVYQRLECRRMSQPAEASDKTKFLFAHTESEFSHITRFRDADANPADAAYTRVQPELESVITPETNPNRTEIINAYFSDDYAGRYYCNIHCDICLVPADDAAGIDDAIFARAQKAIRAGAMMEMMPFANKDQMQENWERKFQMEIWGLINSEANNFNRWPATHTPIRPPGGGRFRRRGL